MQISISVAGLSRGHSVRVKSSDLRDSKIITGSGLAHSIC